MNADFFIGKRNENVIRKAKSLGFNKIYFVKQVSKLEDIKKQEKARKQEKEKTEKDYDAVLIKTISDRDLRKMADCASHHYLVLVLGTNDKINRMALEHKKVSALVSPEYSREYDYLHYRNSGLNQVLCKIARDNNKAIIINFKDMILKRDTKDTEKTALEVLLGRIMQNIRFCKKYNVKLLIGSFASSEKEMRTALDLKSFCSAAGMSTSQTKKALSGF